jgi:D-amino peptidase
MPRFTFFHLPTCNSMETISNKSRGYNHMQILISVDMEGITGVVSQSHTDPAHAEYQRLRKLMTGDVNAAIAGAAKAGATTILVNDAHSAMDNILIEELHPAARLLSGAPKPFSMMQGISPDVQAVFLIGYHARAGSAPAIHDHTWSGYIFNVKLNGHLVGEIGLNAALAGHFGVPVVLVTGDQTTTAEATALLGDVETVAVKTALGRTAADCLPPAQTAALIRTAARQALARSRAPFVLEPPITVHVEFMRSVQAEMAELIPGTQRVGAREVSWTGPDMVAVYRTWRALASLGKWQ